MSTEVLLVLTIVNMAVSVGYIGYRVVSARAAKARVALAEVALRACFAKE